MSTARISAAGAVFAGAIAHNKLRSALAVLAIALGVALGYAVQLITGSAVNELARGAQLLAGDADLQVRGPRGGFDEAIYPQLARLPEVAVASPVVELDAKLAGRDEALKIIGEDAFRAAALGPASRPRCRRSARRCCARIRVFLSPAAAAWLGLAAGDQRALPGRAARRGAAVGGSVARRARSSASRWMDIAGAQTNFDRLGGSRASTCGSSLGSTLARVSRPPAGAPARRPGRRAPAGRRSRARQPVALLSRQHGCPGPGGPFHRRAARLLHPGAVGGAAPRPLRPAARARRDATRARGLAGRRRRAARRRRQQRSGIRGRISPGARGRAHRRPRSGLRLLPRRAPDA